MPVPDYGMEFDDGLLLGLRKLAVFEVGPEIVSPPQPAALSAPLQS